MSGISMGRWGQALLILTEQDVRNIYSMKECVADVEQAFRFQREGRTESPIRTAIGVDSEDSTALFMPAYVEAIQHVGIKVVSVFPKNRYRGDKVIKGVILLTDATTGEHVGLMDAAHLTVMRTGAVSGVATRYLARQDARCCAVLGCGVQSVGQIQAMMEVRELTELVLFNRTREKAERVKTMIRTMYPEWKGHIQVVDEANAAVDKADIIVCSSNSLTPLFDGNRVRPGTHINGIGSYLPHMQEIDVTTLLRSDKIVVDTEEGVMHEAGDFLVPIGKGEWSAEHIFAEIGDIITGEKPGRESAEEITLFKSVGIALLDTVVAHAVFMKAKALGIGNEIEWS